MSLTSRVANLFFSGTANSPEDCNRLPFAEDGLVGGKDTFSGIKLGTELTGSKTMAPKALEEEGRPPYIHVRLTISKRREAVTDSYIVYDCWRSRRYYRWSFDALTRHSEDETARWSTCSTPIYDDGNILLYNFQARGIEERVIRGLAACYAWIFPWYRYILWNLWIQQKAYDRLWDSTTVCIPYKW